MVTFEELEPGEMCQEPDDDGNYTCPICQDYTGERSSVEAHITGKSDDSHKGKVGKDFRTRDENGDLCISRNEVLRVGDGNSNQATESIDAEPEDTSTTPKPGQSKDQSGNQDDEAQDRSESEDQDGGISNLIVGILLGLIARAVYRAAQKTDNEDQIKMEF
jgi:hypothetical protein